jgi:hypothetical protein
VDSETELRNLRTLVLRLEARVHALEVDHRPKNAVPCDDCYRTDGTHNMEIEH